MPPLPLNATPSSCSPALSVEDPLHRLEVPDMRLLVAVLRRGLELRDGLVDHMLRQDVQLAPGLHGQTCCCAARSV